MARGTTQEDRREAVVISQIGDEIPLDDVDEAFDNWRAATAEAHVPGKVTAWQIPMDDRGVPQPTAKNQIRLGEWPIDAYTFNDLCALLIRDFMTPEKILCVRLLGTKTGTRGLEFNRVVTLRAPNTEKTANGAQPGAESLSALMKTIQESNERTLALIKSMQPPPKPETDATVEIARILQLSALINKPMQDLMGMLLPALIGRPVPQAVDPMSTFSGLIDVAGKLADLRGEGGGGGGGPDWLEAIKAIAPIAKPAMEALASTRGALAPQPQPRPAIAAPAVQNPTPPPGSVPTPAPAPTTGPGFTMTDIPSGDAQVFAQLKPQIDALVKIAQDGGDPVGSADLLFNEMIMPLPDDFYDKFGDLFSRENLVSQLAAFHPAVLQHRDFFEKFRKQVDARFDQEDNEAASRPTPPV
jgi:hypothetical protein